MLVLMAQSSNFLVANLLLNIGILGYISENTPLAVVCLTISVLLLARQLFKNHRVKSIEKTKTARIEETLSTPIQIASDPLLETSI
jgi:uncharacterized membrane protein